MDGKAPDWFTNAIRDGIAMMYAINPEGCPGADVLKATVKVWVDDLWRGRTWETAPNEDPVRIVAAFRKLRLSVTRWPTPATFLLQLPMRSQPRRLPARIITDDERTRRIVHLQAMINELQGKGTLPKAEQP